MKILILTVSDRGYTGEYEDRSGPEIERLLKAEYPGTEIHRETVPDETAAITHAFSRYTDADYIFTTGGTGISPRDVTPEATAAYVQRQLPGVAEMLRMRSLEQTPFAALSRGIAGIKGRTILVNFPGSMKGAAFCTTLMLPLLEHGVSMIRGGSHE